VGVLCIRPELLDLDTEPTLAHLSFASFLVKTDRQTSH
jgi:hypothetical protein